MCAATPTMLHAGIVTSRFVATCEFYFEHFGFTPVQITSEYAVLGRDDGSRLALLRAGGEDQPAALTQPTRGNGVWLSLACDDVDALHARLVAHGVEIVGDPEFTRSGDRRCVARDPNGVLIYMTQRLAAEAPAGVSATVDHSQHHNHEDQSHRLRWISSH